MERFYDENEENNMEHGPFFDSDDSDDYDDLNAELDSGVIGFIDNQQSIIDVMHMDLAQTELNQHLLSQAMQIAKTNWRWLFKDTEERLNDIEKIYQRLIKLTDDFDPDKKK